MGGGFLLVTSQRRQVFESLTHFNWPRALIQWAIFMAQTFLETRWSASIEPLIDLLACLEQKLWPKNPVVLKIPNRNCLLECVFQTTVFVLKSHLRYFSCSRLLLRTRTIPKNIVFTMDVREWIVGLKIDQSHFIFSVFIQLDWRVKSCLYFCWIVWNNNLSWSIRRSVSLNFFKKFCVVHLFYNKKWSKPLRFFPASLLLVKSITTKLWGFDHAVLHNFWIGLCSYLGWRGRYKCGQCSFDLVETDKNVGVISDCLSWQFKII